MARHMEFVAALGEIGAQVGGVIEEGERGAPLRDATLAHGERMGDQAEPVTFQSSLQSGEHRRVAGVAVRRDDALSKERELGGNKQDSGRCHLTRREERLLAGGLDGLAGIRVDTGKRRSWNQGKVRELERFRIERMPLSGEVASMNQAAPAPANTSATHHTAGQADETTPSHGYLKHANNFRTKNRTTKNPLGPSRPTPSGASQIPRANRMTKPNQLGDVAAVAEL